jgi:hypothetical protein
MLDRTPAGIGAVLRSRNDGMLDRTRARIGAVLRSRNDGMLDRTPAGIGAALRSRNYIGGQRCGLKASLLDTPL